jgi:hypothetical protein
MFHQTLKEKLQDLVTEARKIHSEERSVLIDSLRVIARLAYWRAELYMGGKHEHVAKKIDRLTEVLSARGHVPTTVEAIMMAVDKLLDQRDQLRRATKMAAKDAERVVEVREDPSIVGMNDAEASTALRQWDENPISASHQVLAETVQDRDFPGSDQSLLFRGSKTPANQTQDQAAAWRKIPEAIKRAVFRCAEGRRQHLMPDGSRCGAMRMMEIEHIVPVARGGGNEASNLTLLCREHNQYRARLIMGGRTMDQYRSSSRYSGSKTSFQ